MSIGRWLFVPFLLAGPVLAQAPSPESPSPARPERLLLRLDGVLYGKGGAKGGGGTKIEDPDQPGTSAGIQSAFGPAIAAEVRVFRAVWVEAGGARSEPEIEFVRSHGLGQPLETQFGRVTVDSYSLGIDFRPARWNVADGLQFAIFARQVWSKFGPPPDGAQVEMDESASAFNGGVRADWRLGRGRWMLGMDISVGYPSPRIRDPVTGSVHDLQGADLLLALGVRWAI